MNKIYLDNAPEEMSTCRTHWNPQKYDLLLFRFNEMNSYLGTSLTYVLRGRLKSIEIILN